MPFNAAEHTFESMAKHSKKEEFVAKAENRLRTEFQPQSPRNAVEAVWQGRNGWSVELQLPVGVGDVRGDWGPDNRRGEVRGGLNPVGLPGNAERGNRRLAVAVTDVTDDFGLRQDHCEPGHGAGGGTSGAGNDKLIIRGIGQQHVGEIESWRGDT